MGFGFLDQKFVRAHTLHCVFCITGRLAGPEIGDAEGKMRSKLLIFLCFENLGFIFNENNMPAAGGKILAFFDAFLCQKHVLSTIWRHFLHKTISQILKKIRLRRAGISWNPGFSKHVFQFSKCCETRGVLAWISIVPIDIILDSWYTGSNENTYANE